jgi:hypothetical protein
MPIWGYGVFAVYYGLIGWWIKRVCYGKDDDRGQDQP